MRGRWFGALFVLAVALFATLPSHAFCGFYVNTGGEPLFNEATRVVLMRAGQRTVMSIQNDYKGPLADFALVVPVPVVLERENVKTLPVSIFDRIDGLTGPRLVEFWEQDPCLAPDDKEGGMGTRVNTVDGWMGPQRDIHAPPDVTVERQFEVDEYDVVILGARASTALETWLHENHYQVPNGVETYLRPYVAAGSKFLVAKVDVARAHFRWGHAVLSPLRFHYDTPDFTLPVRLGLVNSNGAQDLVVHILAADRYETANYENLTIPTNLFVKDETRSKFNSFYAALFDETVANHPHAVVTEYAWSAHDCDPCPPSWSPLSDEDTTMLGGDVVVRPASFTITRLHARYGKDALGDDLVFRAAPAIDGGRESNRDGKALAHGAVSSRANTFQGRYIIHHPWEGPATCSSPQYGIWGGPSNFGRQRAAPRGVNALVDRNLHTADYVLPPNAFDPGATTRHSRGRPLREVLGIDHWTGDNWFFFEIAAFLLAIVTSGIVARRRKLGVPRTVGLTIFVLAAGVIVAVATEPEWSNRAFVLVIQQQPIPLFVLAVVAPAIAVGRERRQLLAFVPALVGFAEAARTVVQTKQEYGQPGYEVSAAELGRVIADVSATALAMVAIGCAMAGVFAIGASLPRAATAKPRWLYAGIAIVGAALARLGLLAHFMRPSDGIALAAIAGAAVILARTNDLRTVVTVVAGVVLLDVATRLAGTSRGLISVTGDSVEVEQVARIIGATVTQEHRRLFVITIDLALVAGLLARPGRERLPVIWYAPVVLVFLALTPFQWLGLESTFANLHEAIATRGKAGATIMRLSEDSFSRPALTVRGGTLEATPGPETPFAPYTAKVADRMARTPTNQSPLLLTRATDTLGSVRGALAPLLKGHQVDYQLVVSDLAAEQMGRYGAIVEGVDFNPLPIDLVPSSEAKDAIAFTSETTMTDVAKAVLDARRGPHTDRTVITIR